jgi:uncharacterized protein (TIGR01777 family)
MKIVIPGGSGLIGSLLAPLLKENGHTVIITSRTPEKIKSRFENIEIVKWDPYASQPDERPFRKADAVINLSGYSIASGRWTEKRKKLIYDSRIVSTRSIVQIFEKLDKKPQVFIAGSAVGYYGDRGDELLHEDSSPGDDFAARVCYDLEQEAAKAEEQGIRTVMVRTGVVLSKSGGALPKMVLPFKLGLGGRLGSGKQWFPWIHEKDLAQLFLFFLKNPEISGAANGVSPGIVTNKKFTQELIKLLKRPAFIPVPSIGLKIFFGEMSSVLLGSQKADAKKIIDAGFEFEFEEIGSSIKSLI